MSYGNEGYCKYCWGLMLGFIGNEYGVAALLGNWVAESGMIPYRLQGDYSTGYQTSINYTHNVDDGTITEYAFVHQGPNGGGYGLAQWTWYQRKQNLYDLHKSTGYSIGSAWLGCNFAWWELNNGYNSTLVQLQNATAANFYTTTKFVLNHYESPQDQSVAALNVRYKNAQDVYNLCKGLPPTDPGDSPEPPNPVDPDQPIPGPTKRKSKWWIYLKRPY